MKATDNNNRVQITESELVEMLRNWGGGVTTASVSYESTPKINKHGRETYGEIRKVANVGCLIGYDYPNSVNNQRERENLLRDFMAEQLWRGMGKRVTPALATHVEKGTFYLTYKYQQTNSLSYFDSEGNLVTSEQAKECFYSSSKPQKQGVDKPVNHREMAIATITEIHMKNTVYEVIH